MERIPDSPKHVAIVGCGFTGTTALYQLVVHYPVQRITVFEASGDFGPGFPYQSEESPEYLLNNTNDTMCLEADNRRAFVEWLNAHPRYSEGLDEKASMPRRVYGKFLRDVIERASRLASDGGIDVEFVAEEVLDLDESDDGVTLCTAKETWEADVAILATGRCPDVDIYGLADAPAGHYFPVHMPGTRLDEIPLDAEVYVLGASLSAYDVVNHLFADETGCRFVPDGENRLRFEANGNDRGVILCSRSGRLKKVQSRHPCGVQPEYFSLAALKNSDVSLGQIAELMTQDAARYGVEIDWPALDNPYAGCDSEAALNARAQELLETDIDNAASPADSNANFIVEYLDAAQMEIWNVFAAHVLPPAEETAFRRRYESAMLAFSAPCPSSTAQKLLALMQAGRLRIVAGVTGVGMAADGDTIDIRHRYGIENAEYLVNATGSVDRQLSSEHQPPLIANLCARGLLREYDRLPGSKLGVDVDMQSYASAGSERVLVANMFLWGPGIYVSAAIMMATIVRQLLERLYKSE